MKLGMVVTGLALATLGVGSHFGLLGCTVVKTEIGPPQIQGPDGGGGGNPDAGDPEDPANQPPHSLGTITLGESHLAGGGTSAPIVSAIFLPDAKATKRCTTKIAGCDMTALPKCANKCAAGEYCSFDDACGSVCKKACTMQCGTDEICTLDPNNQASCQKKESFDAGPIAFSGTTTSITLFPPYSFDTKQSGAPFLAGASIEVQASGAATAGFEKFDEKYTATTFLQTTPALNKIPRADVFGTNALPVGWVPGQDAVLVTVSGAGGSATCKANDAAGHFDVPRDVINAVLGQTTGAATLSLMVARQKKDVKKDKHAKGQLSSIAVQPDGWLELVTESIESASFQGCGAGRTACDSPTNPNQCVDVGTDNQNCGQCGKACTATQQCSGGACVDKGAGCDTCIAGAAAGSCKTQNDACLADTECVALRNCVGACTDNTCIQTCATQHQAGISHYTGFSSCICNTACTVDCKTQCGK